MNNSNDSQMPIVGTAMEQICLCNSNDVLWSQVPSDNYDTQILHTLEVKQAHERQDVFFNHFLIAATENKGSKMYIGEQGFCQCFMVIKTIKKQHEEFSDSSIRSLILTERF